MEKSKTTTVIVRVPNDLRDDFKAAAKEYDQTPSQLIRIFMNQISERKIVIFHEQFLRIGPKLKGKSISDILEFFNRSYAQLIKDITQSTEEKSKPALTTDKEESIS